MKLLSNIGNSSYFNVVIQCLINDKIFIAFTKTEELKDIPIIKLFRKLIEAKINGDKELWELINYLKKYDFDIEGEYQDVHDTLYSILECIHTECKNVDNIKECPFYLITKYEKDIEIPNEDAIIDIYITNKKNGYSFLDTMYRGQMIDLIHCNYCDKKYYLYDTFHEIEIHQNKKDLNKTALNKNFINIQQMFDNYFKKKNIEEEYICKNCNQTDSTIQTSIIYFPTRLILVVDRFDKDGKRDDIEIYIEKTIYFQTQGRRYKYTLLSTINHADGNMYYNEIFIDNIRYTINNKIDIEDSRDFKIPIDYIKSSDVYIIIYKIEEIEELN